VDEERCLGSRPPIGDAGRGGIVVELPCPYRGAPRMTIRRDRFGLPTAWFGETADEKLQRLAEVEAAVLAFFEAAAASVGLASSAGQDAFAETAIMISTVKLIDTYGLLARRKRGRGTRDSPRSQLRASEAR
jgi:hypothetical protein